MQFGFRTPLGALDRKTYVRSLRPSTIGALVRTACLVTFLILVTGAPIAHAQLMERPHTSLYGTPGLIEMPSARLQEDGNFSITGTTKNPDDRVTIAFVITPWLEGTARYSVVNGFFDNNLESDGGPLYDRSLGFKLRLLREQTFWPEIAMGMLDVGGTQIFRGEYIVASKRFGPVDATLGLGFGRLGSSGDLTNPLVLITDSARAADESEIVGNIGEFGGNRFFRGEDAAIFGGVQIETPVRGMNLIAEYSGDAYVRETARGLFEPDTQWNFGMSYAPWENLDFGVGWIGGRELSLRVTLSANLKDPPQLFKIDPPPLEVKLRSESELAEAIRLREDILLTPQPDLNLTRDNWSSANSSGTKKEDLANKEAPESDQVQLRLARFANDLDAQLAPLNYRLVTHELQKKEAIFRITSTKTRVQARCSEIWSSVRSTHLPGVDRLTFALLDDGSVDNRCTLILRGRSASLKGGTSSGRGAKIKSYSGDNANPVRSSDLSRGGPAREALSPRETEQWWSNNERLAKLQNDLAKLIEAQRINVVAINLTAGDAYFYIENLTYVSQGKAVGRVARAVTHLLPPSVERIHITLSEAGLNSVSIQIPRTTLESMAAVGGSAEELWVSSTLKPAPPGFIEGTWLGNKRYPNFSPIFAPDFNPSLFDPDDPLRFQFLWSLGAEIELVRGLTIEGVYGLNIYNNFDTISRMSDSVLPRVRSDFANYLIEGESGISVLQLTYLRQFNDELYGRLAIGYLEDMFGGVSGELLYRPWASRFSYGIELSQVWQRDFDRKFGFRDYEVFTGHVSMYWDSPIYELDAAVHVGRYLAGDYGATFEVNRRFKNGAIVGAFATFTDVPFDEFGEGSFDKGIRIVIPLDMISLFSTRRSSGMTLRPLTRDGGARLYVSPRLHELTEPFSYGQVERTWEDFFDKR